METLTEASISEQAASDIQARIELLNSMSGENLKDEMAVLKRTLLSNPSACMLLRDEDIGMLVSSLMRMTGQALSAATVKKPATRKAKEPAIAKKLTPEELQDAMNSEEF